MSTSDGLNNVILPRSPGAYALVLHLAGRKSIRVGRLGEFNFAAGYYLYLGSALGPGGLAGRLGRHLANNGGEKRPHWHIDYLRRQASVQAVWYVASNTRREHDWAALTAQLSGATIPAPRFGASDCRCPSHLFHFDAAPNPQTFARLLKQQHPADPPLHAI